MSNSSPFVAVAASAITAFCLVAAIVLSPDFALAGSPAPASTGAPSSQPPADPPAAGRSGGVQCGCPPSKDKLWSRPKFADYRLVLDEADHIAALESVQIALTELGDGASYVWHRQHGRLSGIVQPTASFKDTDGNVCRHVVVMLTAGTDTKKTEGVACRLPDGRWQLEG